MKSYDGFMLETKSTVDMDISVARTERARILAKDSWSTGDVGLLLGFSPVTISRMWRSGQLKGHFVPRSKFLRFHPPDVIRFAKQNGIELGPLQSSTAYVGDHPPSTGERLKVFQSTFDLGLAYDEIAPHRVIVERNGDGDPQKIIDAIVSGLRSRHMQLPEFEVVEAPKTKDT